MEQFILDNSELAKMLDPEEPITLQILLGEFCETKNIDFSQLRLELLYVLKNPTYCWAEWITRGKLPILEFQTCSKDDLELVYEIANYLMLSKSLIGILGAIILLDPEVIKTPDGGLELKKTLVVRDESIYNNDCIGALLVELRAINIHNINQQGAELHENYTPLHNACYIKHEYLALALIATGRVNLNLTDGVDNDNYTPLHVALLRNMNSVALAMIATGKVNMKFLPGPGESYLETTKSPEMAWTLYKLCEELYCPKHILRSMIFNKITPVALAMIRKGLTDGWHPSYLEMATNQNWIMDSVWYDLKNYVKLAKERGLTEIADALLAIS